MKNKFRTTRDLETIQPLSSDRKIWSTIPPCSSAAASSLFAPSLTSRTGKKKTIGREGGDLNFWGSCVLYDDTATMVVSLWKPMHAEIRSPHQDSMYDLLHLPFLQHFLSSPFLQLLYVFRKCSVSCFDFVSHVLKWLRFALLAVKPS